jgi:hypothetical protein
MMQVALGDGFLDTLKDVYKDAVKVVTYPVEQVESAVLSPVTSAVGNIGQTATGVVKSTTGPLIAIAVVALVAGGGYFVFRKQISAAFKKA